MENTAKLQERVTGGAFLIGGILGVLVGTLLAALLYQSLGADEGYFVLGGILGSALGGLAASAGICYFFINSGDQE